MNDDKILEIILKTIKYYGNKHQCVVAMEECSELTQAISRWLRKDKDNSLNNLKEEMADVLIVLLQLCVITNTTQEELDKYVYAKLERLDKKLKE